MKNKEQKKEEANRRQRDSNRRGPAEQLHRLDMKLGKGIGSVKERAKLTKKIESANKKRKKK